ncbi:hypothetical protein CF651_04990 [Paenibacillus rigui]|uniref:Uncharacterized protein n=1 Tax=Paenibacillus rigui TaxID=554312 RepID=A0A229UX08_9BACL|nr:hypothetical protein CF651_04990 [Paenibacillus rigui]
MFFLLGIKGQGKGNGCVQASVRYGKVWIYWEWGNEGLEGIKMLHRAKEFVYRRIYYVKEGKC